MATLVTLCPQVLTALNAQSPTMNGSVPRILWIQERGSVSDADAADPYIRRYFSFDRYEVALSTDMAFLGDSLFRNSWSPYLTIGTEVSSQIAALLGDDTWCINLGVPGENSVQIRDRAVADTKHRAAIQIIWAGNNGSAAGSNWDATARAALMEHISDMIGSITSDPKRYLVMGLVIGDYPARYAGTDYHTGLLAANAEILSAWPDNSLDIFPRLLAQADPVLDADDITNEVIPGTLRSDEIHLNTTGKAFVAAEVYAELLAKEWIS